MLHHDLLQSFPEDGHGVGLRKLCMKLGTCVKTHEDAVASTRCGRDDREAARVAELTEAVAVGGGVRGLQGDLADTALAEFDSGNGRESCVHRFCFHASRRFSDSVNQDCARTYPWVRCSICSR